MLPFNIDKGIYFVLLPHFDCGSQFKQNPKIVSRLGYRVCVRARAYQHQFYTTFIYYIYIHYYYIYGSIPDLAGYYYYYYCYIPYRAGQNGLYTVNVQRMVCLHSHRYAAIVDHENNLYRA